MTLTQRLTEYISACFTGLWVQSHEHDDALAEIAQMCRQENWRLSVWDIERGLQVPGGPNDLRQMIDQLRRKAAPIAVLLANRQEDEKKVTLIAGLSRDLVDRGLDAVTWIRAAANVVGGSGGGRSDMAQAGGKLPAKLPEALEAVRAEIEKFLKA